MLPVFVLGTDQVVDDINELVEMLVPVLDIRVPAKSLDLAGLCLAGTFPPTVLAGLTVTRNVAFETYQNGILCGLLSALVATSLDLDQHWVKCLFAAGLFQDLGIYNFRHLARNKQKSSVDVDSDEHPQIAASVLANIKGLPKDIGMLVRHHHECFDGTGFPDGITEREMIVPVQILVMANQVSRIFLVPKIEQVNIEALIWNLKVDSGVYFKSVIRAIICLLKQFGVKEEKTELMSAKDIRRVLDQIERERVRWSVLLKISGDAQLLPVSPSTEMVRRMIHRLWYFITTSGILDGSLAKWLKNLDYLQEQDGIPLIIDCGNDLLTGGRCLTVALNDCIDAVKSMCRLTDPDYSLPPLVRISNYLAQMENETMVYELDEMSSA